MASRVPLQMLSGPRVEAALRFAAGVDLGGQLGAALDQCCADLSVLCRAPIASVYVLEAGGELVLRGNHGFPPEVVGEIRLQVGEGITGTAVQLLRPVGVDDAGTSERFAYFPQLGEERYPAFLAIPLLAGTRARGALVLQREQGPFSEEDVLLAVCCGRALAALIDVEHPADAHLLLHGEGNGLGRIVGQARVLSRALARREGARGRLDEAGQKAALEELGKAFSAERAELQELLDRARQKLKGNAARELAELETVLLDARLLERAKELIAQGLSPSQALERIAGECAKTLAMHGPAARRALEVEAFVGAVARRRAGLEPDRVRRGELAIAMQLPALTALRAWSHGASGALCAAPQGDCPGAALFAHLRLPAVWGVQKLFTHVANGARIALDATTGEVIVNPSAAQTAAHRK